jgi:hypothetical protein
VFSFDVELKKFPKYKNMRAVAKMFIECRQVADTRWQMPSQCGEYLNTSEPLFYLFIFSLD